ncbi:tail fiber domain-containing protein [Flavilitoribacter nigricans]|uniref:Peptidase S74 domain-containing protein n=1 Tax=Flavilitoribacter nigricans (strain ATCC 23147 / DSM 23189 / NBRC 102662 / NCIMB 1420 / SS-2) TaxID=1122177 RepID=A0A2D0NHS4_FLAN2|nr:tail fiber domain-containing protein [Flavilitoribacter nigricans]PHN07930.1 hypothetical protein CRP01_04020 [Flavilitoribacter nigricans DSM 23189 = NBRC 102662]
MKKSTILFLSLLFSFSLSAQFQLKVAGDAQILGRLELAQNGTNVFVGKSAGSVTSNGIANGFFGHSAGLKNVSGSYNTFLGAFSGYENTEGHNNVFIGGQTGNTNVDGSENVFIGLSAGYGNIHGNAITLLGSRANVSSDDLTNATAIGYYAEVAQSNSMVLGYNANVGIGTSAPSVKLEVVGKRMRLVSSANNQKYLDFRTDGNALDISSNGGQLYLSSNNGEGVMMEQFNGNVGIGNDSSPDFKLEVVGTAGKPGGGLWSDASDKRLKTDVEDFRDGLEQIRQIRPVWYRFKGDYNMPTRERYVGVIAQEMQRVAPYTVTPYRDTDEKSGVSSEFLSYNGTAVIYMLVNAAQELAEQNDEQKKTVHQLRTVVEEQQQQIEDLQDMVRQLVAANQPAVQELELHKSAELSQNHPNPFHATTTIDYFLPTDAANARLEVYSLGGQLLTVLPLTEKGKGQVQLKAGSFPAGTYLYSLIVGSEVLDTKRMVLTR